MSSYNCTFCDFSPYTLIYHYGGITPIISQTALSKITNLIPSKAEYQPDLKYVVSMNDFKIMLQHFLNEKLF